MKNKINIAVVGGFECSKRVYKIAVKLGELIAQEGWIVICGGGEGVMQGVCEGAKSKGGITVGILPGYDEREANPYLDVKIPTGLGYARNILVVRAGDFVVAINGKHGTLSEIAFALNEGKPVVGINTWLIKGVVRKKTAQEAISYIKSKLVEKYKGKRL